MSNLLTCVIACLQIGSALKIAVGDDLDQGIGKGQGSPFTDTQTQALHVASATTLESLAPGNDGVQQNIDTTDVEGQPAKLSIIARTAAAFVGADAAVTTPAAPGMPTMTATIPAAGCAAIAAANPTGAGGAACARYALECSSPALSTGDGVECEMECVTAAGVGTVIAVTGATTAQSMTATIAKPAGVSATNAIVEYFDETDSSRSEFGITVTAQNAGTITFRTTHLTGFAAGNPLGGGGGGGVFGDPKATNLQGEKFEILAMGTFSLLSITGEQSLTNRLSLDATVDRAGEMCGATYIKNATMSGSWIRDLADVTDVRVRAAPDVPKMYSLEVAFNEEWHRSADLKKLGGIVKKSSNKEIEFSIKDVTVQVLIDAHRIRQKGVKTSKYANFLNINVKGLQKLQKDGVHLGGLLGYDDHNFAAKAPNNCQRGNLANFKQKMHDETTTLFLSNIEAH